MPGPGTADGFVADITRYVEQQKKNVDVFVRGVALRALATVQELTPVDTGRLRASWQLYPAPEAIKAGMTVTISTNVVYARRVDQGFVGIDALGRHYNQRGVHMIAKTIAQMPAIVEQVRSDLR